MKTTKDKFQERPMSHAEKKQLAYWINQGIDLDQLAHVTRTDVKRWK